MSSFPFDSLGAMKCFKIVTKTKNYKRNNTNQMIKTLEISVKKKSVFCAFECFSIELLQSAH